MNLLIHVHFKKVEKTVLSSKEEKGAQEEVKKTIEAAKKKCGKRGKYNNYSSEERAAIGRYACENGPDRAVRHFTKIMDDPLPETTARRLRNEYLQAL
uniref:Uncharacterized protein n=1 Tax=Amphimedon queenslandica TaxID=400682 RepID=A0A1X7UCI2_AMPQE